MSLGPHIQYLDIVVKPWLLRARSRIIKVLEPDNVDWWLEYKRLVPDALIFGRRPDLAETIDWTSPEKSADEASQLVIEWAERAPHVDYWEGRNEVIINDPQTVVEWEKACAYVRHEIRFANNLQDAGYKATLFQFSAGNPFTLELWRDILWIAPAKTGCLINLHAYSQPTMQSAAEWLTLRHRKVWDLLPDSARTGMIISECGIDGGIWTNGLPPPRPQTGWQAYCSESDYLSQLKWFDGELDKDRYVVGATIFGAGALPPWLTFEISGMADLAEYTGEEKTMTKEDLWAQLTAPYSTFPALSKQIISKGGVCIGTEVIIAGYTFQLGQTPRAADFATIAPVVAWAKTGDWGNVHLAFKASELPPLS